MLVAVLVIIAINFGKYRKTQEKGLQSRHVRLNVNINSTLNSTERLGSHGNREGKTAASRTPASSPDVPPSIFVTKASDE